MNIIALCCKRLISLLIAVLIAAGSSGAALAQGTSTSAAADAAGITTTTTPTFTLPSSAINSTILPTDITDWGGQLGFVRGRSQIQGPPDLAAWLFHGQAQSVDRDSRYSFTGVWSYFGQIDTFLSMIEDKVPALQKVSGELKTPCGNVPQSMPPVPELPSPDKMGKTEVPAAVASKESWQILSSGAGAPAGAAAAQGRMMFSRTAQAFIGGPSEHDQRLVAGTPGTVVVGKSWSEVVMKVGRAFVYNRAVSSDLSVESGRVKAVLPPGASGIVDTAPNGLTRYLAMTDSPRRQVLIYDACNPSTELGKLNAGQLVTVAQEDAVAEDLIPPALLAETIEQGVREEGYLVVKGRFSIEDALNKDPVFSSTIFQSNAILSEQREKIAETAKEHPWNAANKVLTASVQAAQAPHAKGEAAFMPTRGARYGRVSNNELLVGDGAVLVKGGDKPVIVSTEVNRQKVMVQVKSGSVVMVSALDGRATVLNLTDSSPGACMLYLPKVNGPYETVNVAMGQVAEFYINDGLEPASTVLAYKVIDKKSIPGGVGVLIAKYDYLAAMKRFNLSFALPSQDLNRVMKTMAASAFLMRSRSGQ